MSAAEARPSLADIAARTPADRDRYVDFLRAFSIVTVVLGHWAISMIWWHDGLITTSNAIGVTPGLWLVTWFLQVMPIFFFVGGFSNLVTYDSFRRKGRSTAAFLRTRAQRLLTPSAVFLGVWFVIQVALHLLDVGRGTGFLLWGDTWFLRGVKPPGATVPFGPLWFLPAYLVVILLAPLMLRLHRRFGVGVVVFLTLAAIAVGALPPCSRIPNPPPLKTLPVWLLPH
ncbi:MAG: acyltransferase family protein, partial [Actinomycetota bacterium]